MLHFAPALRAVGRLSSGAENIDLEACARAGVEVVRATTASAAAEAEFMVGAMLAMLRRVPVINPEGLLVGRELGGCTVGLVGMVPAARVLAQLLSVFGSRVVGYDPSVHATDSVWSRWRIEPLGLRELIEQSDAVCVQLAYFSRYRGLIGERVLPTCKENQIVVSITHSAVFDEMALARVLQSGRMAAAWMDGLEPGAMDTTRPLHNVQSIQVTPRVASTTLESRVRSAWAVARRIDEILAAAPQGARRGASQAAAAASGIAKAPDPSEPRRRPSGPFDLVDE
jgi:phosphoglycerate dehydrogenase-like enzyme